MRSSPACHPFAQTHRARINVSQVGDLAVDGKHGHPTLHVPDVLLRNTAKRLPQTFCFGGQDATLLPFEVYIAICERL